VRGLLVQTIEVPSNHPDVRTRGLEGARQVAARHGAWALEPDVGPNMIRFRQIDPAWMEPGSYVSLKLPSGVVRVSGRPVPALANRPLALVRGRCETGPSRKRVRCAEVFASAGVRVRITATRAELAQLGAHTSLAAILSLLPPTRVQVVV
jgi:hypothetical protein